jgi:putative colanic acid biosynthesis UDP-glucose lipid carrier transferase
MPELRYSERPELIAAQETPRLTRGPLAPAVFLRMMLDAVVAIGTLAATAVYFGVRIDGPYIILSLLVFSLTFPGHPPRGTSPGAIARDVLTGWIFIVGLLLMLGWATRTLGSFDERVIVMWIAFTPLALFAGHMLMPVLLPRLLAAEGIQRVAVIAGAGGLGRKLAEQIENTPFLGVRVAGFFDDRSADRLQLGERRALGSVDQLAEYAKKNRVDMIYVTLPMASQPRIMKLLDELHDTTASVYFVPDIFIFDLIQGRMDTIGGIPVLAVCETPFCGMNGIIKRGSDIVLASLILLLISPVLLAVAAGVKLTSPGPALFRQRRYGLDGREIVVYKFRSMTVAEDGAVVKQATRNDSRITPFGAFLRRTSLDELPQFINVIQGRMSIVGPRPHAVAHNEMYRKLVKSYMVRHKVRPGITGWAQVNGLRGETETVDKMKARIEYDLDYLRHWSLRLDLHIIWRTIFVVFKKSETAY